MKKKLCFQFLFIIFFNFLITDSPYAADETGKIRVIDLKTCIELAIRNDPDTMNAMDKINIGRLRTKEAQISLIAPKIDLETTYGPMLDFFGRPVSENIYKSKVTVEKPLYKGGELITNYRLGKKDTIRAEYDYRQKYMSVTGDTIKAYYELLSAQECVKYIQALYGHAEQTVQLLRKKFQIGGATKVDVLEAETKAHDIKYKMIKAQGDLRTAIASLNKLTGIDVYTKTEVVKEFPLQTLKEDAESLIDEAMKNRPDLLYAKEDVEYERLRVDLNKSKGLPSLSLVGSYSWEGDYFPGMPNDWTIMLKLSVSMFDSTLSSSASQNRIWANPYNFQGEDQNYDLSNIKLSLFDGSQNDSKLESARANYRLAVNKMEQTKRTIEKDVKDALNKLLEAEATIATTEKQIEFTEEKLKILEEKLKFREATELEVLESRVQVIEAKTKNLQAMYDQSAAIGALYKASGRQLKWKEN